MNKNSTSSDYIRIALDMLLNIVGGNDTNIFATLLDSKSIYIHYQKINNRKVLDQLFDEMIEIFSKAKENMKEIEED